MIFCNRLCFPRTYKSSWGYSWNSNLNHLFLCLEGNICPSCNGVRAYLIYSVTFCFTGTRIKPTILPEELHGSTGEWIVCVWFGASPFVCTFDSKIHLFLRRFPHNGGSRPSTRQLHYKKKERKKKMPPQSVNGVCYQPPSYSHSEGITRGGMKECVINLLWCHTGVFHWKKSKNKS